MSGGEIGLAAALVGERQRADDELAGDPLRQGLHRGVVEPAIGVARKELVAVDQPGQRLGLAPQRVDDVAIVDDMAAAVGRHSPRPRGRVIRCVPPRKTSSRSSWRRTCSRWPMRREGTV